MATVQPHADMITTVYAVSATSSYHTKVFGDGWEYDIAIVSVPTFLTAGIGTFDAGTANSADTESDEKAGIMQGICPLWSLEENFSLLPSGVDKAFARKTDVDHGDSYLQFDGYAEGRAIEKSIKDMVKNMPVIIKYPFWQMTNDNPNAIFACLNYNEAYCLKQIEKRSICIDGDSGEVIAALNETLIR